MALAQIPVLYVRWFGRCGLIVQYDQLQNVVIFLNKMKYENYLL